MQEKLFDSELKVMEIIWEKGAISAKEISLIAADFSSKPTEATITASMLLMSNSIYMVS